MPDVQRLHVPTHPLPRLRLAIALAFALALFSSRAAGPAPAYAATTSAASMSSMVVSWLNKDRAVRGLLPVRAWSALASVAQVRARRMAAAGVLSHAVAGGSLGTALNNAGLPWYSVGENIGASSYPWGSQSANNIYQLWKQSTSHYLIMFSATYNYVGIGFARRSDGSTWVSAMFSESPDHTRPVAHNGGISASGTAVAFSWSGADIRLQTHTAGLRSFDVLYRIDSGTWRLIRNDTTSTYLKLFDRPHGHYYSFRVQAADRRGNLSAWTTAIRVWVP